MLQRCLLVLLLAAVLGCEQAPQTARPLADIKRSGTLVVLTRNAPTAWYIGRDGEPTGPEHDLVEAFAAELGVAVEYRALSTVDAILEALERGEGDLAAAGLTVTDARRARFRLGASYQDVTQQVVCRRDRAQPEAVDDLIGLDLRVIAGSSYSERLTALKRRHPDLSWREIDDADTEALCARSGRASSTARWPTPTSSTSTAATFPN
jgi:membrane-bound lytic murein transglycosylase F